MCPLFFSYLDKNNQRRELPWHKILEFVNIVSLLYEIIPKVPVTQLVFKGERFLLLWVLSCNFGGRSEKYGGRKHFNFPSLWPVKYLKIVEIPYKTNFHPLLIITFNENCKIIQLCENFCS